MDFTRYDPQGFYDELFSAPGQARAGARLLVQCLESLPAAELHRRQRAAEAALLQMGVTFTVYGNDAGTEKIFPFDIVPRIVEPSDWRLIEAGLKQRIRALNLFIADIYGPQLILRDGVIPKDIVFAGTTYRRQCQDLRPPQDVWCHVTGTDLVRDQAGQYYVLEDNLRCPSGVSYMLENRQVLKNTFPRVFEESQVRPVDDYPNRLLDVLQHHAPIGVDAPVVVLLTPGTYNSAYFEHSFLAHQMGVELVEGRDLVVSDGYVYMRTTNGFQRVDVIYRRMDDDFLDPVAFRPDSALGVPGLLDVYRAGRVSLANAPGTGIADDKAIYAFVPEIIRYYLGEDHLLPNVPTYVCARKKDRQYVLDHLNELVVKATNESGGYGMLIGSQASRAEIEEFRAKIRAQPRNYIAQPLVELSRCPILTEDGFEGRHVDLRPYILYGSDIHVVPGGLTRVALQPGSYVVNSSQGGGSKDTWVLYEDGAKIYRRDSDEGRAALAEARGETRAGSLRGAPAALGEVHA